MMEQSLVEYLLNALWQLPLLAGSAWLLLRLLRLGPQTQHGVWVGVLFLGVTLPLLGMRETRMPATEPVIATDASTHGLPGSVHLGAGATHWLVRLYLVSVGIGVLRIAWAWRTARQLVNNSTETCLDSRTMAAFEGYGQRLGVQLPRLRASGAVSSPVVVGLRTASLLLPEDFASHTGNEMRAALCHELAHVARRDYLLNLACEVAAVPLAWHPAMHEVLQRIRTTREMICDAMAAEEMDSQLGYAQCLLALAHSMLGQHGMSLGLFSKHTLEERIMQLTETATKKARAGVARVAAGLAVMIATGAIATTFHVTPTMAQAVAAPNPLVIAPVPAPAPLEGKASRPLLKRKTLTPTEQLRLKQSAERAHQQMAKATDMLNSPEFKQRMEDAQRQMAKSTEMLNSPELKQHMADAQKQMAKATELLNSPELNQHMADAQKQMAKATELLNSPEFKQHMADAQKQMAEATAVLDSPEFRRKMEAAQEEMEQKIREAFPPDMQVK